MNAEEFEKMYAVENTYWWFQGRKYIIIDLLRRHVPGLNHATRVLDVGCGTGLILEALHSYCRPVGIDFSLKALSYCRDRKLNLLILGDVNNLPIAAKSCDVVLALDLLEHIERDKQLLHDFYRIVKPGGYALLSVPAHQFLWSDHDAALSHYRRYSYGQLLRMVREAGFSPVKTSYAISFVFVPIVVFRIAQKLFRKSHEPKTHLIPLPTAANKLLIWLLVIEGFLLRFINLPFGVSIICLAKKQK
jgi:ubiquinone/menaquinone biosynthesis C-methylase UbiE